MIGSSRSVLVWYWAKRGEAAVVAEQLHGTERAQAWQQITAASPRFAQYQTKTDR